MPSKFFWKLASLKSRTELNMSNEHQSENESIEKGKKK